MQEPLGFKEPISSKKSGIFNREELLSQKLAIAEAEILRLVRELYEARQQNPTNEQLRMLIEEQLESLREAQYGVSSERYKKPGKKPEKPKTPPQPRVKKPSERYPGIPVREQIVVQHPAPNCPCCGKGMVDSGMTEDSEQLTVIPKKYEITLQKRVKYRCSCQGAVITASAPPRVIPGGSYSDEMILDVALSKYCDLIPMERYSAMAARGGVKDLPPQSLIELTHGLADFLSPAYRRIYAGALAARVLHADETPHRMLEGSAKKSWYLWGFSTPEHCFFECHDTRSGDVASDVLRYSRCEVLVSDRYSGYGKAVRVINEMRRAAQKPKISCAYCNAHARRHFHNAWSLKDKKTGVLLYKEAEFYLDHYHEIYQLNSESKGQPPPRVLELREQMRPRFEAMRKKALEELSCYSEKSQYSKALRYFLENYEGLTLFLTDPQIPIDNNSQEGLLRNPVVGRKTWYGTHSERGALTAAILFTLVESCKLNDVNPREYFKSLTQDLHVGRPARAPAEFKNSP